ncbi:MAG: response regulator transcription factor [Candidatus Izemoplasma sp.]
MREIKVLLVDDHKLIRDGLKSIINTTSNITVVGECGNGKEALDYLHKESDNVDIILMDITMPEMNGIEATEIITQHYPSINILALTMHTEDAYIMKMTKAGALGYILKDSNREKLIEAIKTVYQKEKYYSNEVSLKLIKLLLNKEKTLNSSLSTREIQVIKSISKGHTNKEIGKELYISDRTVESHRRNIIKKLNLKNTVELVRHALKEGIIK